MYHYSSLNCSGCLWVYIPVISTSSNARNSYLCKCSPPQDRPSYSPILTASLRNLQNSLPLPYLLLLQLTSPSTTRKHECIPSITSLIHFYRNDLVANLREPVVILVPNDQSIIRLPLPLPTHLSTTSPYYSSHLNPRNSCLMSLISEIDLAARTNQNDLAPPHILETQ